MCNQASEFVFGNLTSDGKMNKKLICLYYQQLWLTYYITIFLRLMLAVIASV
jgi:hypothetical protein